MRQQNSIRRHEAGPGWVRSFFPGYFALVMATGIVAVAARLLHHDVLAWPLFAISLAAYPVLWVLLIWRCLIAPAAVLADLASHERGPAFLTIVAATGVLGSQLATFDVLTGLLPALFWLGMASWAVLSYAFLSLVTVSAVKPDLEHGLNGSWLLLVVATEAMSLMSSLLVRGAGHTAVWLFISLSFYLLGSMLYVLISALVFFRWVFRPMHPMEMGAPWWINMGAVAIATFAGARLMTLAQADPAFAALLGFVAPFTLLLWATSSFWIPLLVILFLWKEMQRVPRGYEPGLWSMVFPLGMYVAATQAYAQAARLPFLDSVPRTFFWLALLAWLLTFAGMLAQLRPGGRERLGH